MPLESTIEQKLRQSSRELLDLSGRNRLINTPRTRSKSTSIEIVETHADEVYRRLVKDRKAFIFAAGQEDDTEVEPEIGILRLAQPDDEELEKGDSRKRRPDTLQTTLKSEVLQRRLLRLYHDARTYNEEQGVNILFLAIGFLKWYDAPNSDQVRYAPLLLVPVKLERQSSQSRFKLSFIEEDVSTNLSLKEKMQEFSVKFPDVPDIDDDELCPSEYFEQVRKAVSGQPRWEVLDDDIVLWFFSFTKFLMYRDLQGENWPEDCHISAHAVIGSLFGDGFRAEQPLCGDDDKIDALIPLEQAAHIVDADSSQALAIEEVRRGRHLVIQGPPGTGKSQTIANLIATAVKEGKKVLFVAEKLAALEVVKSRLDRCGVGSMCLELHSNKSNKKAVLNDLAETLDLRRPKLGDLEEQNEQLRQLRDQLNQHVETLHTQYGESRYTPYHVVGQLVRLAGKGIPPASFRLSSSNTWTDRQIKSKAAILQDVVLHLGKVGVPDQHPWRGVDLEPLLPNERHRIIDKVTSIGARLERLLTATTEVARYLSYSLFPSAVHISTLARLGQHLAQAPDVDAKAAADAAWSDRRSDIQALVASGEIFAQSTAKLAGTLEEDAWGKNVTSTRKQIALRGRSWFRWLSGNYRQAVGTLEEICVEEPPRDLKQRLELLDDLIAGQKARKHILDDDSARGLGKRAFGSKWTGLTSEWAKLQSVVKWMQEIEEKKLPPTCRHLLDSVQRSTECGSLVQKISADLNPVLADLASVFKELKLNLTTAFGGSELNSLSLVEIKSRLDEWIGQASSLETWIAYRIRWQKLHQEQLDEVGRLLESGQLAASVAVDHFFMATYEEIMRGIYREFPHLAEFDGQSHAKLITQFRELDRLRIELARREIALAHYQGLPQGDGNIGEIAVVRNEMQKQRRHLPIRQLLYKAGRAIQSIKPVFMMSPISIAQFLAPGSVEFDLLLIDEASQVRPVDALGAIARCKQIVVVGDDKQLPPTMFFEKLTGSVEVDDDEVADDKRTADLESVLGLCVARNITQRMLRWHYRSRHHTLIAVSNHEFYQNKLHIVPNPDHEPEFLGLQFRHVPDGVFDRGRTACNRVEAHAVAKAMIDHARRHPDKSLGVGTFSVAQRDAVRDELELLLRQNSDVEQFFSSAASEPYFVKNLESLQGDERDVIFISVGYARDSSGFFAMAFGPLANSGGERRLNVLISRARERCEVFSSIRSDDIDLNRAKSRGAAALKTFLKYAEDGILDIGKATDREIDSEFEIQVKKFLEQQGLTVDAQVGVAGFFIDLAVQDPNKPGRYLLGIECDGASYHSSRSARDRDRLREQVLLDRGWVIHRIWSSDWFKNSEEQMKRTLKAIDNAKAGKARPKGSRPAKQSATDTLNPADSDDGGVDEECGEVVEDPLMALVNPYREAELRATTDQTLHDVPVGDLAHIATNVVRVEGPIHLEEITRRIASFWGHQRISSKMSKAVKRAVKYAVRHGSLEARGDFYIVCGLSEIPVRNRECVISVTLRNPEMLPPDEVRTAVLQIVGMHIGAGNDEIVSVASRLFGFRSTGPKVRQVIEAVVNELVATGSIRERENRLYAV